MAAELETSAAEWPLVMTADQVAEMLRCNRKTVYEAAKTGALPCLRLGRTIRFHRDTVLAWLAGQRG